MTGIFIGGFASILKESLQYTNDGPLLWLPLVIKTTLKSKRTQMTQFLSTMRCLLIVRIIFRGRRVELEFVDLRGGSNKKGCSKNQIHQLY